MQKRQNSLYPYLVLSDKTFIAAKLETLVFTVFQDFRGFVGSPWEKPPKLTFLKYGFSYIKFPYDGLVPISVTKIGRISPTLG